MKILLLLLVFLGAGAGADCYKILGLFGHPGYSHYSTFKPILSGLSERGHNLTVLGHFPTKSDNYRYIPLKHLAREPRHYFGFDTNLKRSWYEKYIAAYSIFELAKIPCETALSLKEYQDLLRGDESYDLIIAEFFNTNCMLLPLVEKFKIPFIGVQSHALMSWTNDFVGNPYNPSYIPNVYMGESNPMTFLQRMDNMFMILVDNFLFDYMENAIKVLTKTILGDNFLLPSNIMLSTSLILANTHFTIHGARPLVPNIIEIGGIHIGEGKRLPLEVSEKIKAHGKPKYTSYITCTSNKIAFIHNPASNRLDKEQF
ncbi:hypothetical protein RI129_007035 [Pyrocoelia pectoralis]|uniref:Uncharacterized protein n=1 Tax=Pyrocoelia pectoralis TaxID=417401 RepID=A0AAN7ZEK3_9COLE